MKWNLVLHLRNLGKPCRRKRHVHRTGNEMKRVEKQKATHVGEHNISDTQVCMYSPKYTKVQKKTLHI